MTINSSIIALLLLLVISGISSDIFFIPVNLYSYPLLSSKILIRFLCRVFFFTSDYFNCEKHLRGFYFYLLSHFSRAAVNLTTTFTCFSVDSNTAFYQDLHDWHRHTPVQASSFWLASGFFFSFLEIPVNNDFFSTAAHWQILLYKLDLEFDGKSVKVNIWNRFCHTRHLKLFISKSTKGFLTGLFF